jgi:hypothetical protein
MALRRQQCRLDGGAVIDRLVRRAVGRQEGEDGDDTPAVIAVAAN